MARLEFEINALAAAYALEVGLLVAGSKYWIHNWLADERCSAERLLQKNSFVSVLHQYVLLVFGSSYCCHNRFADDRISSVGDDMLCSTCRLHCYKDEHTLDTKSGGGAFRES